MSEPHAISVTCREAGSGWSCVVTVGDDANATQHRVDVPREVLERMDPRAEDPERLVRASFEFLLEREPRESIMRQFELPVIARYFPEWEAEIQKRPGGS